MSGPISLKGNAYDVAWMMRWLAGEDLPMDFERRRPTTQEECEAAFIKYCAITLMNADDQADYDNEREYGWSV